MKKTLFLIALVLPMLAFGQTPKNDAPPAGVVPSTTAQSAPAAAATPAADGRFVPVQLFTLLDTVPNVMLISDLLNQSARQVNGFTVMQSIGPEKDPKKMSAWQPTGIRLDATKSPLPKSVTVWGEYQRPPGQ